MDDHIVSDGMGRLDDVPVEHHMPFFVAGSPAGPEVPNADGCWRYSNLPGVANGLLAEALPCPGAIPVLQVLLDSLLPLCPLLPGAHRCPEVTPGKAHAHLMPLLHFEALVGDIPHKSRRRGVLPDKIHHNSGKHRHNSQALFPHVGVDGCGDADIGNQAQRANHQELDQANE